MFERLLVAAAARYATVVARYGYVEYLVSVPDVGLYAQPLRRVPQLDDAILPARQAIVPVAVEAHRKHGARVAAQRGGIACWKI